MGTGTKRIAQAGSLKYPVWDFNDIDVAAAQNSQNKYYFRVAVAGRGYNGMIWTHGADARTYFPHQDIPTSVLTKAPKAVDAKIEIVWPHDNLPVAKATQVNVGVDLFAHGTLESVPTNDAPTVQLYRSINNGPLEEVAVGDPVLQTTNGLTYPVWQFNNIDVSAARDPQNHVSFWVDVVGVQSYSNVWTHGSDARSYFPKQDVPTAVAP